MGDFEEIKRRVDLKDLVARECAGKVDKIGSAWRFNPCPLCGHRDCFTVGEKGRNLFNCYSCGSHGDSIDFIQQLKGISNIEALRYLGGGRYNTERKDSSSGRDNATMQTGQGQVPLPGEPTLEKGKLETGEPTPARPALSDEKRTEHCWLRRMAAQFYHNSMMNDQDALVYQLEVRKHCQSVLERELIGCATRSLLLHCR
ncbi:MAG: CHC2 zinc finger domain-containing protein, partial [Syntrophus sp. (in: bacteria)]